MEKFLEDFEEIFYFLNYKRDHPIPTSDEHIFFYYSYENVFMTLFKRNMKSEKINLDLISLPRDIKKIYWYRKGTNDEIDWNFLCKIKYNEPQYGSTKKRKFLYIYFVASCDYTGFDCQGTMKGYVSKSLWKLLELAVNPDVLDLMRNDTNISEITLHK